MDLECKEVDKCKGPPGEQVDEMNCCNSKKDLGCQTEENVTKTFFNACLEGQKCLYCRCGCQGRRHIAVPSKEMLDLIRGKVFYLTVSQHGDSYVMTPTNLIKLFLGFFFCKT